VHGSPSHIHRPNRRIHPSRLRHIHRPSRRRNRPSRGTDDH
jgi:hypothetical protein